MIIKGFITSIIYYLERERERERESERASEYHKSRRSRHILSERATSERRWHNTSPWSAARRSLPTKQHICIHFYVRSNIQFFWWALTDAVTYISNNSWYGCHANIFVYIGRYLVTLRKHPRSLKDVFYLHFEQFLLISRLTKLAILKNCVDLEHLPWSSVLN